MKHDNLNRSGNGGSRKELRSIYERAAADGAWLGVYFVALFGLSVASMRIALLNIVVLAMALMVPFIAYRYLRRTYVDCHGMATYSALWMQGILTFGCASLILSAAAYLFMRWIYPDFILDTLRMGVEFYRSEPSGAASQLADEFQAIIDTRQIPSPVVISIMWLWLGTFTGSILSMFLAVIVRIAKVPLTGGPRS